MKIGFVLFEAFHQRQNIGSSRIRGHWIMKYLNRIKGVEAEPFVQGKKYDVIVFQKVYWKEIARAFNGIKVFDICDPDWLDGAEVVDLIKHMDLVTTSTDALRDDLKDIVDIPVHTIPDGEDFEILPRPKIHKGKAKSCVWFGYSNNMDALDPTYMKIKKLDLTLKVISDSSLNTRECDVENIKWDVDTVDAEIQKADFALLPDKLIGRFKYKSPNKTIHSQALGLPVAKNPHDMERFMVASERQIEADLRYKEVKENNSVEKSAKMLYDLIKNK